MTDEALLPHPPNLLEGARVTTPDGYYCTGEENLRVTSFGSVAGVVLAVRMRFLKPDGTIVPSSDRHVPNSDRSAASSDIELSEGWILAADVHAVTGTPRRGQVFVVIDLIRGSGAGATVLHTLLQGYVTDTSRLVYPGSPIVDATSGAGVLRSIAGANPGAGAEITETVPANARWRLLALRFTFVTSAAVANREVEFFIDDGTTWLSHSPSGFTQTASLTIPYSVFHHAARNVAATASEKNMPLPRVDLQGGMRFGTITTNLQGGDDFSAPQYLVEEWIED